MTTSDARVKSGMTTLAVGHDIYHIGLYETFPGFIHFSRKKINFVSS